jgi:UDP-N-acetylmuramoyl-L-alanyl-D-glutamate--2,6-diaminopimelate ligase
VPNPSGPPVLRPAGLPPRTLAEVAARLGVQPVASKDAPPDVLVRGVTLDSRSVQPGDLYAALPGARAHGADFADRAAELGAVAGLTDEAGAQRVTTAGLATYVVADPRRALGPLAAWVYGEPATALTTIGVTGTNGKTTTAYLLESGLRAAGHATGLIGTIETRIGDDVLSSVRTTPEAPDLQALLAVMRERGVRVLVMEVSSHALAMQRVDGTTYDVAVFTNLTEDHLDFHADLEDYFAAKALLFTPEHSRSGVVNIDDEYGARLAREATVPVVTVSPSGGPADWRVTDVELDAAGSTFTLHGPEGQQVRSGTRLAGDFNLVNAALAVVALARAGVDLDRAAEGVLACAGVAGRMERVEADAPGAAEDVLALVDFAHSPDSLERLLATCRQLVREGGRLLLVIGAGGDRDQYKRPVMGEIAARDADVTVLTSDNPRSEDPLAILAAMSAGAERVPGAVVEVVPERRAAIERVVALARPGDVVVVAGKGHEQGQEIDGVMHPFDDRVVLREALGSVRR